MLSVVPWTRTFDDQQLLLAINSDPDQGRTAWVSLDPVENPDGARLPACTPALQERSGRELIVQATGDGARVSLSVPAAGFVIYERG